MIKIAVIAPSRYQGETTVSMLLAKALHEATHRRVCLTVSGRDYDSASEYLNLHKQRNDVTKSTSQLVSLLKSNEMTKDTFESYLTSIEPSIDILLPGTLNMTEEDSEIIQRLAVKHLAHDYVVTDVASALDSEIAQHIYQTYDFVFVVLTPNSFIINKLQKWRDSGAFPPTNNVAYIVNKYLPEVVSMGRITKALNVQKNVRVAKINMLPAIQRYMNNMKTFDIIKDAVEWHEDLFELNSDIEDILEILRINLPDPAINWRRTRD